MSTASQSIITLEPGKRSGKPTMRGLRITVYDILSYLAAGMTTEDILADADRRGYPSLPQLCGGTRTSVTARARIKLLREKDRIVQNTHYFIFIMWAGRDIHADTLHKSSRSDVITMDARCHEPSQL
jgi:uncharacterized protein (DUF433 family)